MSEHRHFWFETFEDGRRVHGCSCGERGEGSILTCPKEIHGHRSVTYQMAGAEPMTISLSEVIGA